MSGTKQDVSGLLDELAIKIMLIEPGDLSAVGELLEILEKLRDSEMVAGQTALPQMLKSFQEVLQELIMGEISDTSESYEQFAECVGRMQETVRDGVGEAVLAAFCGHLNSIGCKLDAAELFGLEVSGSGAVGETPSFLKDRELLECFIDESFEHLGAIEALVLELEKDPEESEAINGVFRAFHAIKGTALSLDLGEISALAHATENLLSEVRSGHFSLDTETIEGVLNVSDTLTSMVSHVRDVSENGGGYTPADTADQLALIDTLMAKKGGTSELPPVAREEAVKEVPVSPTTPDFLQDVDLLSSFISEAFEHLESIELNVLELENNPEDLEIINNIFRPFHTVKGVSGFLNLMTINKLAHATENLLDDVRNGKLSMNSDIIDIVLSVGDFLRTMIQNVSDVLDKGAQVLQEYDITEFVDRIQAVRGATETTVSPITVSRSADELQPSVQPLSSSGEKALISPRQGQTSLPAKSDSALKMRSSKSGPAVQKKKVGASIKVDVEKLDGLVNAVGELVIMQTLVRHNPLVAGLSDPKLNKDFGQLTRITTDLQKTAMSMRMVPIRQTFQKMTRLVRDLSKKTGKIVNLVMEGEETEIDRNMVDSIYDPLVHMIRNSVDHGVQMPNQRLAVGKPEAGTVRLSAYQKGGHIIIEVADDGEGVNTGKTKAKAIERGLIQEGGKYTDHEINNLIFLPGFSTADKITDVSGRGVGMDVVKKGVENLRGRVELQSTPGEGSLFLMYLPLTLAIIDGIVVGVGAERYIIPIIAIRESMRPQMENYNTIQGKGETLLIRNSLIPVVRLYHVFGVENACTEIAEGITVIIENEGRQRALLVDELLGKQEVVIKSLGGYMQDIQGVAGGTILGDGRVGLILDLAGLISASEEKGVGGGGN